VDRRRALARSRVGATGQLALGILTACVLAALLVLQSASVRFLALGVVVIATVGEVVGSLDLGALRLPPRQPACVRPTGPRPRLPRRSLVRDALRDPVVRTARRRVGLAGAWGLAGVLPATDVAGAFGCAFLLAVFAWTRQPVYAGVFLVVALLELYGTALGTWTWEPTVSRLGLLQGNPPSGVASGYVVFDVLASLAVWLRASLGSKAKSPRFRRLFGYHLLAELSRRACGPASPRP
jgi:hypothetical protein